MHARVAQFEGVNAEVARSTMAEAEAIIRPMMEGLPGYSGEMMLVSPEGKFLSITLFESQADAEAAEMTFDKEMPARLGHLFKDWEGRRTSVDRYEVAVDAR